MSRGVLYTAIFGNGTLHGSFYAAVTYPFRRGGMYFNFPVPMRSRHDTSFHPFSIAFPFFSCRSAGEHDHRPLGLDSRLDRGRSY